MSPLENAFREAGGRVIAALAARYRDLDIAEDGFGEACARAARVWLKSGPPQDPAAWLYRAADRIAIDLLRRRRTVQRLAAEIPPLEPAEADILREADAIPDERLRLIFVCCHPAVDPATRAALTLRMVCGLSTVEIARAFLLPEPTLAQRIARAKRKIAEAGVPFEVPGPNMWPERLDAVLSTIEIAYAKAHEDAAGAGAHAVFATEALELTQTLAELLPSEPDALALAALARYGEARRPARLDPAGVMTPLSEQDPARWRRDLIAQGDRWLARAGALQRPTPRLLQARIHSAWCARTSLDVPPPWEGVLKLYDALLALRDDVVVRLNRAVALSEVCGADMALAEVDRLDATKLAAFLPYHAVRADLLRRLDRYAEAQDAYRAAIALGPAPAERLWLERKMRGLTGGE